MTSLARQVIGDLLSGGIQEQAAEALAARGLGGACVPDSYTGFISWATVTGTCTLVYSPDTMLLVDEERRQTPRLLGVAPYDAKAIEARNWSVFDWAGARP